MAIDSAAKRMSAMTVGGIAGYVYPTGTIGPAARQDVVGVYRGILAGDPVGVGVGVSGDDRYILLFGLITGGWQ